MKYVNSVEWRTGDGKLSQRLKISICRPLQGAARSCDGWFTGAAEKQELLLPSLLVAVQQQPREKEGKRGMDVDAAAGEGEEDGTEAEKGALAGKHHLSCKTLNIKVSIKNSSGS